MIPIMNETEWAKQLILGKEIPDGNKFEAFRSIARYYLDCGYPKKEVRRYLDAVYLQYDPNGSLVKNAGFLDSVLKAAQKRPAVEIDEIVITEQELQTILALNNPREQRLLITLLCLSKYWDAARANNDHWVNSKDPEIMKIANISTSIKRQSELYHDLWEAGLISFSKKVDNTNVRVLFQQEGDPVFTVSDFGNLGYQLLYFLGDQKYFRCRECGMVVPKSRTGADKAQRGRPQTYCKKCATERKIKKAVNSIMRPGRSFEAAM